MPSGFGGGGCIWQTMTKAKRSRKKGGRPQDAALQLTHNTQTDTDTLTHTHTPLGQTMKTLQAENFHKFTQFNALFKAFSNTFIYKLSGERVE